MENDPERVRRLAAHLGVPPQQLVRDHLERAEDAPGHMFRSLPCPFLADNRCSVYEARPDDCRSFPHLHKDEFLSRLIAVVENCSICPIVYNVYELLKEEVWQKLDDPFRDDEDDDDLNKEP